MARAGFVRGATVPLSFKSRFTFRATIAQSADDSGMCSIIAGTNIRSPCNLVVGSLFGSSQSSVMISAIRTHHGRVQMLQYSPLDPSAIRG